MTVLIQALLSFFTPAVVFFVSLTVVVAFLVGALANPQGLMNSVICSAIDYVALIFPSTPNELKIGSIIDNLSLSFPIVGRAVIKDIFTTLGSMFSITLAIKIYKLMPFTFK